ncbi:MAG: tetratricopeptide repeat protein, partial [Candidatus Electrothrix sp.]
GGMGKSALAARAVRKLPPDRFPDGIIFHTFYHQPATDQALQSIAHALHLSEETDLKQQVALALGNKQALLILDGAEEATDLRAVLALRGSCGVLITSRKKTDAGPLRLDLQPLPGDQAEEVLRAWGGDADDQESIERISELLGGWPVALRLAGHYLHSTGEPAADYLRWLEQEPFQELGHGEQHQAENAALLLQRSAAQVGEDSRLVLGLAGCLAFDLLAIAPMIALLEDDERRGRAAVNELVNYGLLERREDRLHIGHALIHQYAAKHLGLSKETLARVAHYYIGWCETQSAAGLPGYALLDEERAHCLRLIAACLDSGLWREVQGLEEAMWEYLDRQGYWIERLATLEIRLTAAQQAGDRKDEGKSLNNLGYTCNRRSEFEKALAYLEPCLPIRREVGDREGEGATLNNIGFNYQAQGEHELALECYEQSLSIRREIGDWEGEGATLNNIGRLYYHQGEYAQALQYYEQCLPIGKEVGDKIGEGATLNNIAEIYRVQGNVAKALEYHEQALIIRRELGDRAEEAGSCWNIGRTYYDRGELAKAEEYMVLAVQIAENIGHPELELFREGLELLRVEQQR